MKKLLLFTLCFLSVLSGYSQSSEQVVKNYISTLNDFLMSPNNSSARQNLENALSGCTIQDGIYIKYKEDVKIEDVKARDYVGIMSDVINANEEQSYAKVAIACGLETTNGGTDVVAYLAFSGAILMNTVTVFRVERGRITAMTNDIIKTKDWKAGKAPCSTPTPSPLPQPSHPTVPSDANNSGNDTHLYVDLGLPSGTLWATCNVGANNPWEYGDYFAWGETTTKTEYSWATYKYANGAHNKLTKYCQVKELGNKRFTDSLKLLERSDDVAYVHWGNNWCMPTPTQWQELVDKCLWTWTTSNGNYGFEVKGRNENTIFLPSAGYKLGTVLKFVGCGGYYWSSSLARGFLTSSFEAIGLDFDSFEQPLFHCIDRFIGYSVRPVRSKTNE